MPARLFEAIIDANHSAPAGNVAAGLRPADFQDELPVVALTCIDVRLNRLLPQALGVPEHQFIWLRNAGNIITGSLSSTIRSLALACALKGGRTVAIIGHTDCQVGKFTTMDLIDRFRDLGIPRERLPENLIEFFGTFASERANVIKAVGLARHSPLLGPRIPVHGLLLDTGTGRLDWLVNGYQELDTLGAQMPAWTLPPGPVPALGPCDVSALKFPDVRIGQAVSSLGDGTAPNAQPDRPPEPPKPPPPPAPPKLPSPPPVKPPLQFHQGAKYVRPKA